MIEAPQNRPATEYLLVFLFCLAVILGPAIALLFQYNITQFPDCKTYLGLASFDLHQDPVRGYRVVVPFIAGGLNHLLGGLFSRLAPAYFPGNFSLPFSFFVVNTLLSSFFGLLVYRYCRAFGAGMTAALVGTLAMLTCRYTGYIAAMPLVDALFCVVVALTLLGIRLKNTSMLLWTIFLGPVAKESFIFIAPLIFCFSHLSNTKLVLYFILSGLLVFGFRYAFDLYTLQPALHAISADTDHIRNIPGSLHKLFSFYGINKVLMNTGLWIIAPLWVCLKDKRLSVFKPLDRYLWWFVIVVLLQVLFSGSVERMVYLAMPVFCVVLALSVDVLISRYNYGNQ